MGSEQALSTTTHLVRQYAQLGRTVAACYPTPALTGHHQTSLNAPTGAEMVSSATALSGDGFWDAPFLSCEDSALFHTARTIIDERLAQADLPVRLIHADLVTENVLIQKDGLAIIDFDNVFEVGPLTSPPLSTAPIAQTMPISSSTGFSMLSRMGQMRWNTLTLLQAARALTYVGWIVPRLDEPGEISVMVFLICRFCKWFQNIVFSGSTGGLRSNPKPDAQCR